MATIIRDGVPGLVGNATTVNDNGVPAVPQTVTPSTSVSGALQVIDDTGATVDVALPLITGPGGVGVGFVVKVAKLGIGPGAGATVTPSPAGPDTINGAVGPFILPINPPIVTHTFVAISSTNWLQTT